MNVAIIGAGISGLYSAIELQEQGYNVTIYEALDRLGGRIYTHRFKPQHHGDDPFFEAGAMRLPLSSYHSSVFDFVRYLNSRNPDDPIELLPFVLQHPNNKLLIENHFRKCGDTFLAKELGLPPRYHNRSAGQILNEVMQPWIDLLRADPERGIEEVLRYDEMSFRHYLRHVALMPSEVIDFVELIQSQTSQYDNGFVDLTIQTMHFNTPEWVTINGGLSRIIEKAAKLVGRSNIHLNSPVRTVEEHNGKVTLSVGGIRDYQKTFDKVLFAMPPAAIQKLRSRPKWSLLKEQAIRSTHEGPLYKMGIHFRRRFWETVAEPSFGGQDQTDFRIRWVVFPSQELGSSNSGCLVAYCGMTDALRWGWMEKADRLKLILEDLDKVFKQQGVDVYEEYLDSFDARWPSESLFSNTMYYPGQYTRFHKAMAQPERNIFFAGEYLSVHHTWIAGSTETAHDAVKLITGNSSLKRLGDTSHLETGPIRHGWQIAEGIAVADSGTPHDSPMSLTPQKDTTSTFECGKIANALSQVKIGLVHDSLKTRNSSVDSGIGICDPQTAVVD